MLEHLEFKREQRKAEERLREIEAVYSNGVIDGVRLALNMKTFEVADIAP